MAQCVAILFLFLLNNRVLAPFLFLKQKVVVYVVVAILLSTFTFWVVDMVSPQSSCHEAAANRTENARPGKEGPGRESMMLPVSLRGRIYRLWGDVLILGILTSHVRLSKRCLSLCPLFRGPFLGRMLIALLMFSFNIAVKLFFKSVRDQEAMKELEHNNLQTELDYLKYQINPHFFMNTLNNIHALVDIDTEKAKQTIVELSRLMRYVLYESNNRLISLSRSCSSSIII